MQPSPRVVEVLEPSWNGTLERQGVREAQEHYTRLAKAEEAAKGQRDQNITAAVREVFDCGGDRTWTLSEIQRVLAPRTGQRGRPPGSPSIHQINAAVWVLLNNGIVARVTAAARGWASVHRKAHDSEGARYRRVSRHATDQA